MVCKLKSGSENYHPIAYSHQIYQKDRMFVPTRHHHDNQVETVSHYDHNIYSINTKSLCGSHSESWNHSFLIKRQKIPNFQFHEIIN